MDNGAAVAYGSHKADKPMELESIKRGRHRQPPTIAAAFGHAATVPAAMRLHVAAFSATTIVGKSLLICQGM